VDRFLAEVCPEAKKEKRWAGLLPMAQDTSLWDTPCAGPGWALLGDAAGHVHPITGEGIAYALWSAELLAQAFQQKDPQVYEGLWRERYGRGLLAASGMLRRVERNVGAYEIAFQLLMAMADQDQGKGGRSATFHYVRLLHCDLTGCSKLVYHLLRSSRERQLCQTIQFKF
jgi:flavin-dependent dehydrogenase